MAEVSREYNTDQPIILLRFAAQNIRGCVRAAVVDDYDLVGSARYGVEDRSQTPQNSGSTFSSFKIGMTTEIRAPITRVLPCP